MTGDPLIDVFVLQPATDLHARSALMFYAQEIQYQNPALAAYLRAWVGKLFERDTAANRLKPSELPDWILDPQAGLTE